MALNWTTMDADGMPLPLQQEKNFLSVAHVAVSLKPTSFAAQISANGTIHISNKRITFISSQAKPGEQAPPNVLATLSIPLGHFQDGRFVQPWFAANYYEATVRPVPDGGLTEPHTIKIDFNEGRAYEFATAIEEVKTRFDESHVPQEIEELPMYEAAATDEPAPIPSQSDPSYFPAPPMPPDSALEAAATAREEEEEECERREVQAANPPSYAP